MSDAQEKASKTYDPFEPFRTLRDAYLDAMSKTMVEAVNTEAYAQATGAMLEGYLSAIAPLREALDKSMLQALGQLELPSRQEVAALAERFTCLEMRLDDMDAKLDAIRKGLDTDQDGSKPRPANEAQPDAPPSGGTNPARERPTAAKPPGARRPMIRRKMRRTQR